MNKRIIHEERGIFFSEFGEAVKEERKKDRIENIC